MDLVGKYWSAYKLVNMKNWDIGLYSWYEIYNLLIHIDSNLLSYL